MALFWVFPALTWASVESLKARRACRAWLRGLTELSHAQFVWNYFQRRINTGLVHKAQPQIFTWPWAALRQNMKPDIFVIYCLLWWFEQFRVIQVLKCSPASPTEQWTSPLHFHLSWFVMISFQSRLLNVIHGPCEQFHVGTFNSIL